MNWGKSIILAFVLFGGFIATLVTVCVREDISLVTKDYYKEELVYQRQLDRMAHTAMLTHKPSIDTEHPDMLRVSYSDMSSVEKGALQLFRPSDASLDKTFELRRTEAQSLYFSTEGMQKGMYRARLSWTMHGEEFFLEQIIHL